MTSLIYVMTVVAALLLVGAAVAALRDRRLSIILICATILIAAGIAGLSLSRLNGDIGPEGYAKVEAAAARDSGADAMAQTALEDGHITISEYVTIHDIYQRDTGRDMNKEPTNAGKKYKGK